MALNKKISELDSVSQPDGTEFFPVVKSGLNYRMTIQQIKTWFGAATSTAAGLLTSQDKNKLDGINAGATANASNAFLLDRGNHSGSQPAASINGLANVATSGQYGDLFGRPTLTPAGIGAAPAGHVGAGGSGAHPDATSVQSGFLSAAGAQFLEKLLGIFPGDFLVTPMMFTDATGADSATATEITASFVRVSSGTDLTQQGIRIPTDLPPGAEIRVKSGVSIDIMLYPPTGGQINYAGVDIPLTVSAYQGVTVINGSVDGQLWDQF